MADKLSFSYRFMDSRWMLPQQLTHMIIYGATRQGKSQSLKSCAERAYLRGCKIIDLYSAGTYEGAFWSLPSVHPFWHNRELKYSHRSLKAMEFPTNVLIPNSNDIPTELPDIFKVFTISISDLTEEDLAAMLGNDLSNSQIALWRRISENITKKTTFDELLQMILEAKKADNETLAIHGSGVSGLYNMFQTFKKLKLFTSDNNPKCLNLENELKNKKVVSSLILTHFPEKIRGFIINHFMYKIFKIAESHIIKHPIIVLIRESGDFLANYSNASAQELAVKRNMTFVVRKGAKHRLYFWMDNQSPINIDVIVSECQTKIVHKVDDIPALQQAIGTIGAMLLTRDDYNKIRQFPPGRCFVFDGNRLFNPQMMPPLSRMSAIDGADFIDVWREVKGARFKDMKNEINPILEEYENAELEIQKVQEERKRKIELIKEVERAKKLEEVAYKEKIRETLRQQREAKKEAKRSEKEAKKVAKKSQKEAIRVTLDEDLSDLGINPGENNNLTRTEPTNALNGDQNNMETAAIIEISQDDIEKKIESELEMEID